MHPFENLADFVYEKLHEQSAFSEEDKKYIKGIIDNAIHFVIRKIRRNSSSDEQTSLEVQNVATNTAAFLAIVVGQLEFFAKGQNDGPFFDMIREMIDETEDNNGSGYTFKKR